MQQTPHLRLRWRQSEWTRWRNIEPTKWFAQDATNQGTQSPNVGRSIPRSWALDGNVVREFGYVPYAAQQPNRPINLELAFY